MTPIQQRGKAISLYQCRVKAAKAVTIELSEHLIILSQFCFKWRWIFNKVLWIGRFFRICIWSRHVDWGIVNKHLKQYIIIHCIFWPLKCRVTLLKSPLKILGIRYSQHTWWCGAKPPCMEVCQRVLKITQSKYCAKLRLTSLSSSKATRMVDTLYSG